MILKMMLYEMLRVGPTTCKKRLNVLLPGNPGLVSYYEDVAVELSQLTQSPVLVVGYLGFHSNPTVTLPSFDLEAQISHSRKVVEEASMEYDRVCLVGHSIGALIALECAADNDKVDSISLLMPFLAANDANPGYLSKKRLAAIPGLAKLLALVGFFVSRSPSFVRRAVMPTAGMSCRCKQITEDVMSLPSNLHEYVTMGASEFKSPRLLLGPPSPLVPKSKRGTTKRLQFIYSTQDDPWVRREDSSRMAREYVSSVSFLDVPHDFPTCDDCSRRCAEVIAGFL